MKNKLDDMTTTGATSMAQALRKYINDNNLKPGDRLPTHAELSRKMRVGIRRLREGLSILDHEGLIITNRKGGTRVSRPSLDYLDIPISWHLNEQGCTIQDLIKARAVLEEAICAEAAKKRKARDLLVILDTIERMETVRDDIKLQRETDEAFHFAILSATHNPAIKILCQLIHSQFIIKAQDNIFHSRRRMDSIIKEHRKILNAIEQHDSDQARELMRSHIISQVREIKTIKKNVKT